MQRHVLHGLIAVTLTVAGCGRDDAGPVEPDVVETLCSSDYGCSTGFGCDVPVFMTVETCEFNGHTWIGLATEALCLAGGYEWIALTTQELCEAAGRTWQDPNNVVITGWTDTSDAGATEPDAAPPIEETATGPTEPDVAPEPTEPDTDPGPTEPDITPEEPDAIEEVETANGPPIATDDHSATFAGEVLHIEVRRNDTDPDDDELSIVAVTDGAFGTVAVTDGGIKVGERLTYTPNDATSLGLDTFTYTIADPDGLEDTATVTVNQVPFQDNPVLTILSPKHDDPPIESDTVTISFEAAGCYFTSPSVDDTGCHGHKWVDGEKWSGLEGGGVGHYNTSTFEIGPLTDGLHVFEFVLHKNDGTDDPWEPEVTVEVSFQINGGYVPPEEPVEAVELSQSVSSMQPASEAGELLLGTPVGLYRTQGEEGVLPHYFGPTITALARDPFTANTYYASGQWPDAGKDLWGLATSTNSGQSWAETSLLNEAMFEDLAVGTDTAGYIAGVWASQVHVSTDSGATWSALPLTVWVDDLVFASTDPTVLLLAGPDGIQSLDWATEVSTPIVTEAVTAIDRVGQQIAYVTSDGTIHLCTGALTECTTGPSPTSATIIQLASEMADPDILYLLTNTSQVFRSPDGGETWALYVTGGP